MIPLIREVPPELLKRRPEPGKWSAHEHFCHLTKVHPMFFRRLDLILTETDPFIVPYSPDKDEEGGSLMDMDLEQAIRQYETDRAELVARVKKLSPEDWQRNARHGEYTRYSIFIMCRHVAMHDMLHAYRIEDLLLRKWE